MSVELKCPAAPNVTGASTRGTESTTVGSSVQYNCSDDHTYPDGTTSQTITCEKLGPTTANWTSLNHTECIGISTLFILVYLNFNS